MVTPTNVSPEKQEIIELPTPERSGGKPLLDALEDRRSSREFSDRVLDISVLSSLLWAAFGINRADGRRTSPSAVLQCFALAEARRSAADASLPKGGIHPLGLSGQRIPVLGAQVLSLIMRANGWSCSSLEPKTFTPASATA